MRKFLVVGLALAAVPVGIAFAESDGLKVTGGGQAVFSEDSTGPGDTIAFNAQQTADVAGDIETAKGQLQVIKRDPYAETARGKPQVKFHGIVTCITEYVDDNDPDITTDDERFVRFGGFERRRDQVVNEFTVDTQDNGEGTNLDGVDMIFFRQRGNVDDPCEEDMDPYTQLRSPSLYRGNVQEH